MPPKLSLVQRTARRKRLIVLCDGTYEGTFKLHVIDLGQERGKTLQMMIPTRTRRMSHVLREPLREAAGSMTLRLDRSNWAMMASL